VGIVELAEEWCDSSQHNWLMDVASIEMDWSAIGSEGSMSIRSWHKSQKVWQLVPGIEQQYTGEGGPDRGDIG
jgi:hypothetical protein